MQNRKKMGGKQMVPYIVGVMPGASAKKHHGHHGKPHGQRNPCAIEGKNLKHLLAG